MLNTMDDFLHILDGMGYLKDVMNKIFLVVASLIMLFVNLSLCGDYDFNLLRKIVLYCQPLLIGT